MQAFNSYYSVKVSNVERIRWNDGVYVLEGFIIQKIIQYSDQPASAGLQASVVLLFRDPAPETGPDHRETTFQSGSRCNPPQAGLIKCPRGGLQGSAGFSLHGPGHELLPPPWAVYTVHDGPFFFFLLNTPACPPRPPYNSWSFWGTVTDITKNQINAQNLNIWQVFSPW